MIGLVGRNLNRLRWAPALLGLALTLPGTLLAGEAAVSLRVVDETAPPGGLAVVYVELTEPKPLSSGRVRFAYGGGPLGEVVAVALLAAEGEVEATLISTQSGAVVEFTSPPATFGTTPDLPIMAIAISVRSTALPGQSIPLNLDLGDSIFLDPQGQPYPKEVKPGVFTVGGASITDMDPSSGRAEAGTVIRFSGVGFQPGFDLNVEGASFSNTSLNAAGQIEATLGSAFNILRTTRVRLRNPDGAEDFFYPAVAGRQTGVNHSPLAAADSVSLLEDTAVEIDVLSNDSDPDDDPLVLQAVGQPRFGSAQPAAGRVVYTPAADFFGADSFPYTVSDGRGGLASATVAVFVQPVNDPPVAVDEQAETAPDQPLEIAVLDNDTDVDGDPLSLLAVPAAEHGLALPTDSATVLYVPPPGFQGLDRFEYLAADGQGETAVGRVEVLVRLPALPPTPDDDGSITEADEPVEIAVLENDSDPNGEALTVEAFSAPAHGLVETGVAGGVVYRPGAGFVGSDGFTYTVADGSGMTSRAFVAVAVNSPDSPHRFLGGPRRAVRGTSMVVEVALAEASASERRLELSSSTPAVLQVPDSAVVPAGSDSVRFSVFAAAAGAAVVEARLDGLFQGLPMAVLEGSVTEFPVSLFDPPSRFGLALANRSGRAARVLLRAFPPAADPNDAVLEAEVALGPFQQTSRPLADYDPRFEGFRGWLRVSSEEPRVFATFLNFDESLRGLAGSSSAVGSRALAAPCLAPEGSVGFDFSLINNNPVAATVDLSWSDESGIGRSERREIGPQGVLASAAREVSLDADGCRGSLIVESSQPLAAYQQSKTPELLLGQRPSPISPGEATLFLPQSVSGGGWTTTLALANASGTPSALQVTFRGEGLAETRPVTLGPGATQHVSLADLFGWNQDETRVGSLEIQTPGGVSAASTLSLRGSRAIAAAAPAFPEAGREAIFSQAVSGLVQGVRFFTGIAVQNPAPREAFVIVDVFSNTGDLRGMGSIRLGPLQRRSTLLQQLFPELGALEGGHVRIRSTEPVAALEIFGDLELNFLAAVAPAVPRTSGPAQ